MHSKSILILVSILFIGLSCSKENPPDTETFPPLNYDTISFAHSMKGWELYCWPNGDAWNFALLIGTNRLKSYAEVVESPLRVTGLDSLEELFEQLPFDEDIIIIEQTWLEQIWGEAYYDLQLPPPNIVASIRQMGSDLELHIGLSSD